MPMVISSLSKQSASPNLLTNMITFESVSYVEVRLDKKIVGRIKKDDDGLWRYYPTFATPGDGYASLRAGQDSLR